MIRKIMIIAASAAALFVTATSAVAQERRQVMLDKVVAVVGGSSILHSEVTEYAEALVDQRRQMGYTSDRDPMNEALEALLEQKLLYNQALIDSVPINSADIAGRIETYLQMLIEEAGGIAELETKEHMPIFAYREMLRTRNEEQAYAQAMRMEIVGKVAIVPGEVEQYYNRIETYLQMLIEEAGGIAELETKEHMPIFAYREMLRTRNEEQAYAQAMRMEIVGKVAIVPGEVEQYYNRIDKDSLPIIGEQYVYAQITKLPASLKDAQRRTKERLLDMRERVIKGETKFSTLARMYSLDGSAIYGGEMEPGPSSMYVRPFAEALEKLKPGQVSEIVETEFGFHIIELIDKKGENYHCRHILLRPTFTRDELMQPAHELDSIAHLIRVDSMTFEDAALRFSDDASSRNNGGIVSNHDVLERMGVYDGARLTATRFLKEDFGQMGGKSLEDYNALMRLKKGEVSNSFQTTDLNGNQLSKIVKLVDIIPAHVASLDEDYIRIEEMALEDKQQKVYQKWLESKIDGMYVYIDPAYRSDEFTYDGWIK